MRRNYALEAQERLDKQERERLIKEIRKAERDAPPPPAPHAAPARAPRGKRAIELNPLDFAARTGNELRPQTFGQMVGQPRLKDQFRRIIHIAQQTGRTLEHILLSGQSGTGKTTFAQVVAHELGRRCFQVQAPLTHDVFLAMQEQCCDGDIVIVDEIHQQVSGDRRGVTQAADPETYYHAMEDRRLPTETSMLIFPAVTFIGCTTDAGLLPEAFIGRFPLRPTLDAYTDDDMQILAEANARSIGLRIDAAAAMILGRAARQNPRQLNDYVKNARALAVGDITVKLAVEVVRVFNNNTLDGLTPDMQGMLRFLLSSRRESKDGTVVYQASVNTIATALGKSRDTKVVALYVEPWLISKGLVQVTHGGRQLTHSGIDRANQLHAAR